jgi:FAD/FMN-containing dehydrogenase
VSELSRLDSQSSWLANLVRCAKRSGVDWILRSDVRYQRARLLYNRFHDLYPAVLLRTRNGSAVADIVRFASDHDVPIAIRGGGHHIAGYGSCDGGIVIDFSPFRRVDIDRDTGIIEVEPGARLCDIDRKLCRRELVLPTGTVSETGITGLTLGGGIGWLVGRAGLTCDHLIGADVVLADGREVRAEDPGHFDLLWGLRGGGGNFGVVTRLRYRALPLPTVTVGSATVALERAATALEDTFSFLDSSCPRDLTVAPILTRASGVPKLSIDFCLAGGDECTLRSLSAAVGPAGWSIQRNADYQAWQSAFDSFFQPPMRGYWKAWYGSRPTKVQVSILIEALLCAPNDRSAILVEHLHGAFGDAGLESSAFPLRSARFGVLFSARWRERAGDALGITWVRNNFARLDPSSTSAAYSNYSTADDTRVLSSFTGDFAERLALVKCAYDPANVFAINHNIKPQIMY